MGSKISVLLPTARPELVMRAFNSIKGAADGVSYEVIIVADFPSVLPCNSPEVHLHCTWIVRERAGVGDALRVAHAAADGDYLFWFNDESVFERACLRLLLEEAERNVGSQLLSPLHLPRYMFEIYGRQFVPFPFAHRNLFEELGGMTDPAFKAFYIDPDLGMRAHAHGVPIKVVEDAVLHHHNGQDDVKSSNWAKYFNQDQATFRAKWDHLGAFRDC